MDHKIKKSTCYLWIPKIFISKSFATSHMGYHPQNINHVQSLTPYYAIGQMENGWIMSHPNYG